MKTISEINTSTIEGKLLLAALAKISTESQTNKTPDEILEMLNHLSSAMFDKEEQPIEIESTSNCPCAVMLSMFNPTAELPDHCTCEYIIKLKEVEN